MSITINGRAVDLQAAATQGFDGQAPLLDLLREGLGLVGTRQGCGQGECGACHVLQNGRSVASCTLPIDAARGQLITTVEALHPLLREAFEAEQAAQCGYCSAGLMVTAAALLGLADGAAPLRAMPDEATLRSALDPHLCRCGAHPRILRAVQRAARQVLEGHTAPESLPASPTGDEAADAITTAPSAAAPATPVADIGGVTTSAAPPAWAQRLSLRADGQVLVHAGKVEIGQGIHTALAQIAADALGLPIGRLTVLAADTARGPDEGVTSGSLSVQEAGVALREACAQARADGFAGLAALPAGDRPHTPPLVGTSPPRRDLPAKFAGRPAYLHDLGLHGLGLHDGHHQALGQSGQGPPNPQAPAASHHGLQIDTPLHGRVLHPPTLDAEPADDDASIEALLAALRQLPGVQQVRRDGRFFGVIALRSHQAERAINRLAQGLRWVQPAAAPSAATDLGAVKAVASHGLDAEAAAEPVAQGPQAVAPAPGVQRLYARYTKPWIAHASIGPSAALARWRAPAATPTANEQGDDAATAKTTPPTSHAQLDGGEPLLDLISHSQGIVNLRRDLALAFGLADPAQVRVRHAEGAGCYGHNGADDVAFDAAWLARQVPGRWLRLLWRRADEFAIAPMGPAMQVDLTVDLAPGVAPSGPATDRTADGIAGRAGDSAPAAGQVEVQHWHHAITSAGHSSRPGRSATPALLGAWQTAQPFARPASIDMPLANGGGAERNALPGYGFARWSVTLQRAERTPLRSSALRSLGAAGNVFAAECMANEVAAASGEDALAWRRRHLTHDARGLAVLDLAVARAEADDRSDPTSRAARSADSSAGDARAGVGTGASAPPADDGRRAGRGLAQARYKGKGAWCAVVTDVEVAERVRLKRLVIAADLGLVVNPDGARAQLEGGALQAASWALLEGVLVEPADGPAGLAAAASPDMAAAPRPSFTDLATDMLDPDAPLQGAVPAPLHGPPARVAARRWAHHPILRFSELPTVEVHLVDSRQPSLGAGEASIGPTIAAIGNALHAALGVRVRQLPFSPAHILAAIEAAEGPG